MAQSRFIVEHFGKVIEGSNGDPLSAEGSVISDVAEPVHEMDAANKRFVFEQIADAFTDQGYKGGPGIQIDSDKTIKVVQDQPQITSVGTLQGLNVNGNVNFTGTNIHVNLIL